MTLAGTIAFGYDSRVTHYHILLPDDIAILVTIKLLLSVTTSLSNWG
jgi:hypothetical protein